MVSGGAPTIIHSFCTKICRAIWRPVLLWQARQLFWIVMPAFKVRELGGKEGNISSYIHIILYIDLCVACCSLSYCMNDSASMDPKVLLFISWWPNRFCRCAWEIMVLFFFPSREFAREYSPPTLWVLLMRVRDTGGSYSLASAPEGICATNIDLSFYKLLFPVPRAMVR